MKIKILKPEAILLEGHIRLAFHVDDVIDIGNADAEEAIRLGIAEQVEAAPPEVPDVAPKEKAIAAPKEKKVDPE